MSVQLTKDAIRSRVWDSLEASGAARFPFPPHHRIPNFAGADTACDRLTETAVWTAATTLKCNPDAPQLPVRRAALRAGKTVYMAQPRLRDRRPFLKLDPKVIDDIDAATTVSGVTKHGVPVAPETVSHIDLVVSGSVAVTSNGARIGKGEGYSDLEWGVLSAFDAVSDDTTVVTTVHEQQVIDGPESALRADVADHDPTNPATTRAEHKLPDPDPHDVPLDCIYTPERTIHTESPFSRPTGIDWRLLDDEQLAAIPVLERLSNEP